MVWNFGCDCGCNYNVFSKIVEKCGKIQKNMAIVVSYYGCGIAYNSNIVDNFTDTDWDLKSC